MKHDKTTTLSSRRAIPWPQKIELIMPILCSQEAELHACWRSQASASSQRRANLVNYVLKHNLILHLSMHALLVKRLITNDSVNSSTGPRGDETSQIAFSQPNMPGWHMQQAMKTGWEREAWNYRRGEVQGVTAIEKAGELFTYTLYVSQWGCEVRKKGRQREAR